MREVKRKSAIPIYGVAAVWLLYCLIFPLYKTSHFCFLIGCAAAAYVVLSFVFPGKTEYVEAPEEPVRTGDEQIDALLEEGERTVAELRGLSSVIADDSVRGKLDEIIIVTDKIFKDVIDDPTDYKQIKRFSEFYLPTTTKLMHAYERFRRTGAGGDNISGTLARIDGALDTILDSYRKFFDSLFENQALDIETDIMVLENMLKQEGLL